MEAVVVAVIGAVPATIAAVGAFKGARRASATKAEVQTNHGMRAGEYLERIDTRVATLSDLVAQQATHQAELAQQLADHIRSHG